MRGGTQPLLRQTASLVTLILGLLFTLVSSAGGLTVLPTRIDFGANRGVQSVLITNTSAQTVTVETQVEVWPEGAPGQLANDVVVTPAVVTLPPNQRMRLRIGLLRPGNTDTERAYRLYFTELAAPAALQGAGIGVRLRIGIPVFVAPAQAQPQALQWSAQQEADGWSLTARNPGNTHKRAVQLVLSSAEGSRRIEPPSNYVLARSSLIIPLQERVPPGTRVRWLEGDNERESPVQQP